MIGKKSIESLKNINSIGFDVDHTFLKYRIRNFNKLLYDSSSIFLINHLGYPADVVLANEQDEKRVLRFAFRSLYDHNTGLLLKVDSNYSIMRAFRGFQRLHNNEIKNLYGTETKLQLKVFENFQNADFTYLHDNYGAALVPLLGQLNHMKSTKKYEFYNNKTYFDFIKDIMQGTLHNYIISDMEKFKEGNYDGYFYPRLLSNPLLYANKIELQFLKNIQKIRESGKKVFLMSNNYFESCDLMFKSVIGTNWREYFDFMIFQADKPHFFKESEETKKEPFTNLKGEKITDLIEYFESNKKENDNILNGGNSVILNKYFRHVYGNNYQTMFCGDSIYSDCYYAFNEKVNPNWKICLILEELQELEEGYPDKEYYNYCMHWGSALNDKCLSSGVDKTYMFFVANRIVHNTFSSLYSKEAYEFFSV